MQTRLFTYILFCALLASCVHHNKQASPEVPSADTIKELSYNYALTVDRLQRFKIGKADTVENSMEADLANDTHFLYLIAKESKNISEEERTSIYQQLIMLSVMNEKFDIQQWRQNRNLQKIFTEVQLIDQEFLSKVRCRDWENPFWSGQGCKDK